MTTTSTEGDGRAGEFERLAEQAERLIIAMESIARESGINLAELKKRQATQEKKQEKQETRQKKQRRITLALVATFAIDLFVTLAVIFIGAGMREQSYKIENIQSEIQGEVLCPLYQQFINADTPRAREVAKASGQDMEVRERAFKVIRDGYATLDCKPHGPENQKP